MHRRLPPLTALRAFEAAARHLSFRGAAEELNVTPSAVSHQIKGLEAFLGTSLFRRLTRQVQLTDAGRTYLPALGEAFDQIEAATRQLAAGPDGRTLVVSVTPTFATEWLVPRLIGFQSAYPDVELRMTTQRDVPDFATSDVALAIPHGNGHWPGLQTRLLMREHLVPVCSPELLARGLGSAEDLSRVPLIHVLTRPDQWAAYLESAGMQGVRDEQRGPTFQSTFLALEAAMAGLGVALGNRHIIGGHIDAGRLVVPFECEVTIASGYYLVHPPGAESDPSVAAFCSWLLEALAASDVGSVAA